jgi:hypothetical protein
MCASFEVSSATRPLPPRGASGPPRIACRAPVNGWRQRRSYRGSGLAALAATVLPIRRRRKSTEGDSVGDHDDGGGPTRLRVGSGDGDGRQSRRAHDRPRSADGDHAAVADSPGTATRRRSPHSRLAGVDAPPIIPTAGRTGHQRWSGSADHRNPVVDLHVHPRLGCWTGFARSKVTVQSERATAVPASNMSAGTRRAAR